MNKKDHRSVETFKKDILFTTKLENFWFQLFLKELKRDKDINLISYNDKGTDNTGKLAKAIPDADYEIRYRFKGQEYSLLLEVKWAPTFGKAVFKTDNIKNYINQGASILMFYNVGDTRLKKPKDYNFKKHIELINRHLHEIRWGIIHTEKLPNLLKYPKIYPYFFGKKECVEISYNDFHLFLTERIINEL